MGPSTRKRIPSSRRIAILASGVTSPLFSAIQFAKSVDRENTAIHFFAPASTQSFLTYAGFDLTPIPDPKLSTMTPLVAASASQPKHARLDAAIAALGVEDLAGQLQNFDPDLIVVDCEMHAHIIVALSLGVPVAQSNNMFLSPPGLQAPPLHKKSTPGHGFWGSKAGIFMIWVAYLFRKQSKILRRKLRDRGADHATALTELAKRLDVPIYTLRRQISWLLPWTYSIPTLLFLPKSLDLPTKPYPNMFFVGPMIWATRPSTPHDDEKVARFCSPKNDVKKIYVAFGSMMTPKGNIVSRIWDAAKRHPDWEFLCVVGSHWDQKPAENPPDNVSIVTWAPQHDVLIHADLAIIHGGTSSLVEAVSGATPLLVYPHVLDQWGSAARATFHGIGREGNPADSADQIESDIVAIFNDPAIQTRVTEMQDACQDEIRADAANRVVDDLICGSQS